MRRTIRAVLFDMDGVLWQSTGAHAEAFRLALNDEIDYSKIAGQRTIDVMRSLRPGLSETQVEELARQKSQLAHVVLQRTNPVTAEALDVVERLSCRLPLALATSGSPASAALFLDRNQARDLFRATITGSEVTRAKPAPDLFLRAAQLLNVAPENCLVVEDAHSGVQAARAAGCRVALFGADESRAAEWGADYCLTSLSQLLPIAGLNARPVFERGEWQHDLPGSDRATWTTLIPAAGRGTRLGYDLPKALFPVAGRPILDWLLELFDRFSSETIVIASPSGRDAIQDFLTRRGGEGRYRTAVQPEPLGMGHAVACGLESVTTPNVMVVWGDQAALRPQTIDACQRLHSHTAALATMPTLMREQPYIHFERDPSGRLTGVLQKREGDPMPGVGESDTGLFLFRTNALRRYISQQQQQQQQQQPAIRGRNTKEQNFLPLIPLMDVLPGNVVTARIATEAETVGVNTREDAELLARHLIS